MGMGWIQSCKLDRNGKRKEYKAQNGGGYTLEALLDVKPNGDAEPDYKGWEVKQHSIKSKVITMLTPEPDGGDYFDEGVESFVLKYGYPDSKNPENRKNFGGIYKITSDYHHKTGLKLKVVGYLDGEFNDGNGFIGLETKNGTVVAKWSFAKLLKHWSRKHSRAVFAVSDRKVENKKIFFKYLNYIHLGIGTSFKLFLDCVERGDVYLDPALKVVNGKKKEIKARNQFRVKFKNISSLYNDFKKYELK